MNFRLNERSAAGIGAGLVLLHGAAVLGTLGSPGQLPLIHQLAGLAACVVAIAGTVLAARAFSAGDYLRRVWSLFAVGAVLLFLASLMRTGWMLAVPGVPFEQSAMAGPRTLLVVVLNLLNVSALVLLALTYRRSGLKPPRSWVGYGLWALCTVAALAVTAPQLLRDLQHLSAGGGNTMQTLAHVVSTLGDLATIVLVAPILRVAYMMRGGKLAWVWWAMAASGAMWIVYDAHRWEGEQGALALFALTRTAGIALKGLSGLLQCAALEREPVAQQTGAAMRSAA